ncbi:MAG: PQQ-like beta-propeller repeat protein [Planctomycetes bacterium]|nr:PQQ-like beta-propeller repeat protein [Planctomycetota bacterium]
MTPDERLRREERAVAARPGDAGAWARLSREHERLGRRDDAVRAALRAFRAQPDADGLARLRALGAGDGLWPAERGDAQSRQVSPLDGPDEGVLRWRLDLPRACVGRPLLDLEGRAVLRARHAGLLRVDAEGRRIEDLGAWRPQVAPLLVLGDPLAWDGGSGRRVGPAPAADVLAWRGTGALAPGVAGGAFALGDALVALAPDGAVRWTRPGPAQDVACSQDGSRVVASVGTALLSRPRAFDAATGAPLWEGAPRPRSLAELSPEHVAAADDGAWLVAAGLALARLDPDGAPRWERKLEGPVGPPATVGDRVVVTTGSAVHDLDLATGATRWRRDLRAGEPPTLDPRGVAYVATYDGRLVGLRPDGRTHCQAMVRGTGAPSAPTIGWDGTALLTVGRELVAVR